MDREQTKDAKGWLKIKWANQRVKISDPALIIPQVQESVLHGLGLKLDSLTYEVPKFKFILLTMKEVSVVDKRDFLTATFPLSVLTLKYAMASPSPTASYLTVP